MVIHSEDARTHEAWHHSQANALSLGHVRPPMATRSIPAHNVRLHPRATNAASGGPGNPCVHHGATAEASKKAGTTTQRSTAITPFNYPRQLRRQQWSGRGALPAPMVQLRRDAADTSNRPRQRTCTSRRAARPATHGDHAAPSPPQPPIPIQLHTVAVPRVKGRGRSSTVNVARP